MVHNLSIPPAIRAAFHLHPSYHLDWPEYGDEVSVDYIVVTTYGWCAGQLRAWHRRLADRIRAFTLAEVKELSALVGSPENPEKVGRRLQRGPARRVVAELGDFVAGHEKAEAFLILHLQDPRAVRLLIQGKRLSVRLRDICRQADGRAVKGFGGGPLPGPGLATALKRAGLLAFIVAD
ncbi:MAG: hypothetical protein WCJ64_07630 [Rhodospirillaceae bacterium]